MKKNAIVLFWLVLFFTGCEQTGYFNGAVYVRRVKTDALANCVKSQGYDQLEFEFHKKGFYEISFPIIPGEEEYMQYRVPKCFRIDVDRTDLPKKIVKFYKLLPHKLEITIKGLDRGVESHNFPKK